MYLSLGASDYTSNDSGITAILASLDFLILDRDLDTLYGNDGAEPRLSPILQNLQRSLGT